MYLDVVYLNEISKSLRRYVLLSTKQDAKMSVKTFNDTHHTSPQGEYAL
jgi:hypothetical protein